MQPRGFIALMSVVIIGAILLVFVYLLSASSFLARFDALDGEDKRVSLGLAEACVNAAVLQIAQSNAAAGQVTVDASDPKKTCRICSVDPISGAIFARAVYNGAYTNLAVTVDNAYNVTAWSEQATYSGPSCTVP